ncbi:HlyD family efflux transporter periplasmic adaptor subunit [Rhizobium sp. BK008]|uniref:HlyD family efflux transporter periplasmic adaptor subunit n=1 Tax=Rhizobium sp. BK008 TaxID=2587094 RepID=UPI0016085EFE|nr:HlyD family efflux transporter periplasmic adaptor subunit [Rhizobium sp. BK008]MBB4255959.1 multidrug resistance efflux pump [Rhizobium sp. BK008]
MPFAPNCWLHRQATGFNGWRPNRSIENRHNLTAAERQLAETEAARAALERQRDEARAEYTHQVLSALADAEREANEQTEDLVKAERKLAETELRAPIDGVVQQLAIHTLGGVVTPAQQLLVIVPEPDSRLEGRGSNAPSRPRHLVTVDQFASRRPTNIRWVSSTR